MTSRKAPPAAPGRSPELRRDPVVGRWVIIAPERGRRPFDLFGAEGGLPGQVCPFCAGNESQTPPEILAWRRQGSRRDGPGWRVRVFANKFPALRLEESGGASAEDLHRVMGGVGAHEVVVETPDHDRALADLPPAALAGVLRAWRARILALLEDRRIRYVMVFKNQGARSGASLAHSHSQIIALPVVPREVAAEVAGASRHYRERGQCVFCSLVERELDDGRRRVDEEGGFAAVTAFAPRKPYEIWILPRKHAPRFEGTSDRGLACLARLLGRTLRRLRQALGDPDYNLVLHTAPPEDGQSPAYHWHLEILPQTAGHAGFEWGTGFFIGHVPPEEAAERLRQADGGLRGTPRGRGKPGRRGEPRG